MLSSRGIPIVFSIFFLFVILQWILSGLGGLAGSFRGTAFYEPSFGGGGNDGLASIDFSFIKNNNGTTYISQGYGRTALSYLYIGGWHNGIDIPAKFGAPILSPSGGMVLTTGNQDLYCYGKGYGKFVAVKTSDASNILLFAHLSSIVVSSGEAIKNGETIGKVGQTGLATAPHLHFSVFEARGFSMQNKNGCGPDPSGHDIDPVPYLRNL